MNRQQRHAARNRNGANHNSPFENVVNKIMLSKSVTSSEREDFIHWSVESLWDAFKVHQMNQRIEIENDIMAGGLKFPNGTVGKEYNHTFSLPAGRISNVRIQGTEELGLTFSMGKTGEALLAGTPLLAGDFNLMLSFNTVEGQPRSALSFPVAFNPDPRSLWKNIPTDENIPYFKKDEDSDYLCIGGDAGDNPRKDVVAASQRGRSHAQEGKPRDDHFSILHCPESDWYILAVADGAGSAKYSRKGSETACTAIVEHCRSMLADNPAFEKAIEDYARDRENATKRTELTRMVIEIVYKGAVRAHEAVKKAAAANEESKLRDFATTLMFAIVKKYDFGWFISSFWVGDGAICLFDEKKHTAKLLGVPDEGEFSGQTRFLTMPEIFHDKDVVSKRLRMTIVPDFTALFLMTDGVSDPLFETEKNLNDYTKWEEFWKKLHTGFPEDGIGGVNLTDNNEEAKHQLLRWLNFWSPGNHDDRTIAILY